MAGATTQAERQAQVLAAGYNGPMTDAAINQAYANAATPEDLASSGLSGFSPQTGGTPGTNAVGVNPTVTGQVLNNLQALANQEYLKGKLALETDENAWKKAAQAIANEIAIAGQTGIFRGVSTQDAIKQMADLAQQQAATMLSYATQFGMWGPPSPGQLTLGAQKQAFDEAAKAGEMTGWYTPYAYNAPSTQGSWAAVGTPSQGTALGMQGTATSWDQMATHLKGMTPGFNEDAAKRAFMSATGTTPENFNGGQVYNLGAQQLNEVVSVATGGRFNNWAQLSYGQPTTLNPSTSPLGTGYFVGGDGRVHIGSPQGGSQAGWGPDNQPGPGVPVAAGWAPGTEASDPNIFLRPPSAQEQQAMAASYGQAGPLMGNQPYGQQYQYQGQGGTQYFGAPNGYQGGAVRTLAGAEQDYTQWLRSQQQALEQWKAQQSASQNYLNLLSNLRGPADWAKYQQVLGATPGGMQSLVAAAAGQYIPGGGATTGMQPEAANLQSLVNQASTGGASTQQQLQQAQGTLVAPNQMAPQTWNNLAPSQQQMLLGIWESQGYNKDDARKLFEQSLPRYAAQSMGAGQFRLQ